MIERFYRSAQPIELYRGVFYRPYNCTNRGGKKLALPSVINQFIGFYKLYK